MLCVDMQTALRQADQNDHQPGEPEHRHDAAHARLQQLPGELARRHAVVVQPAIEQKRRDHKEQQHAELAGVDEKVAFGEPDEIVLIEDPVTVQRIEIVHQMGKGDDAGQQRAQSGDAFNAAAVVNAFMEPGRAQKEQRQTERHHHD